MVNLELYRVFYTVAKCGSLTRAAEELFISQPAVSQAIKQLEGQLDTPLFNRTHRGMELSEQGGKQIFDIVERALGQLETAENKLKEINQTMGHVVGDQMLKPFFPTCSSTRSRNITQNSRASNSISSIASPRKRLTY